MNPARPLAQAVASSTQSATAAAGATAARTTPRRRVRPSASSSSATTLVPPSRDLIGPPCPLSNLRPVYYAPLFPSLHAVASPSSSSTPSSSRAAHPYSLSEFPTASPSSSSSSTSSARAKKLARLRDVQHELATADLAWRLARYRLDAFNQAFWARHNAEFLRQRDAFLSRQQQQQQHASSHEVGAAGEPGAAEAYPPGPSAALSPVAGGASDVALASFYAAYLEHTRADYARYNTQLWRMQGALLWPAVRAEARRWRWRWECRRAGVKPHEV
ncbi:uncharacterized protein RHOBADRAFT_43113 [Rhodotorula graminis WP1]|uniref:Uncharacterized protein n=1 Tax=Rhodotorula graminis (strain WP1) TaxID=578459 RepID=A0A194S582_RHOGW|nr:uncharacterized protein RHOBADRAFT_43113 [Rhodotorula graminis WP1]KPV75689.1 hypothetical protein RHOBADRAFT_43113 [Rhodotorula graminis WP1]